MTFVIKILHNILIFVDGKGTVSCNFEDEFLCGYLDTSDALPRRTLFPFKGVRWLPTKYPSGTGICIIYKN